MFTQCHRCETVFRLSADALRAAGGQVRCGKCGEVFNALARLAEDATGYAQGESSLDMESRADEILQSRPLPAQSPDEDTGDEALRETSPAEELTSEASLEFTLPPGDLDKIFIETTPSVLQVLAAEAQRSERGNVASPATPLAAERAAAAAVIPFIAAPPTAAARPLAAAPPPAAPANRIPPPRAAAAPAGMNGLEVSDRARQDMLSGLAAAEAPPLERRPRRLPRAAWVVAAVALAVLLALQWVLTHGDWLATHAPLGLGAPAAAARLSAYQLRQWGITGDPAAKGTLRVRATITNTSTQPQPHPLLRVTLADRFGKTIAQREFEASDYLGKGAAHLLAPGESADAVLDILDPGKEAESFEIDVCLREPNMKIACAGEHAAAAPSQ